MRLRAKSDRFESFDWRIACSQSSFVRLVYCFVKCRLCFHFRFVTVNYRGGVEDTRLEANDAKKLRSRRRTAPPSTDPFEAKDKTARGQG